MKVFISWSGDLSCQIAQILKTWLPCFIQSVEVFYSSEDIEKGDNWDKKISCELSDSKYGIICLTSENTEAPWIHFEAGAIAKTLDSRVTALMVNIKPSDIKGPLSRYQATKFEKQDFFQLVESINNSLEEPLNSQILQNTFNAMWNSLQEEVNSIISNYKSTKTKEKGIVVGAENAPLEEILQLLRKQSAILSNPEELLPKRYFEYLQRQIFMVSRDDVIEYQHTIEELIMCLDHMVSKIGNYKESMDISILDAIKFEELFRLLLVSTKNRRSRRSYLQIKEIQMEYESIFNPLSSNIKKTKHLMMMVDEKKDGIN